jgi:hypothetical protein
MHITAVAYNCDQENLIACFVGIEGREAACGTGPPATLFKALHCRAFVQTTTAALSVSRIHRTWTARPSRSPPGSLRPSRSTKLLTRRGTSSATSSSHSMTLPPRRWTPWYGRP